MTLTWTFRLFWKTLRRGKEIAGLEPGGGHLVEQGLELVEIVLVYEGDLKVCFPDVASQLQAGKTCAQDNDLFFSMDVYLIRLSVSANDLLPGASYASSGDRGIGALYLRCQKWGIENDASGEARD